MWTEPWFLALVFAAVAVLLYIMDRMGKNQPIEPGDVVKFGVLGGALTWGSIWLAGGVPAVVSSAAAATDMASAAADELFTGLPNF